MRIITGKHKNREIPYLKNTKYRPSMGKLREALFSILSSGEFATQNILNGAKVLDLFSGTGSIGFEALSRGADFVTFVDKTPEALKLIQSFAATIEESEHVAVINKDVITLGQADQQYNIIFMDPPYLKGLVHDAINVVLKGGWLSQNGIIIAELAKNDRYDPDSNKLKVITERIYGKSKLLILQVV